MKSKKIALLSLTFILFFSLIKGNEIIYTLNYTADPTPLVYNGRVYVYCTHDRDPDNTTYNQLYDYICLSSDDLVNWTDHGPVFDIRDVEWLPKEEQIAWAPEIAKRNGAFYLYWCTPGVEKDREGTAGTGVAISDTPVGPFKDAIGKRLIKGWYVDADILIEDGQAYICWPGPRMYKLKDNMIELEGEEISYDIEDSHEAAYLTNINGKYQYSYQTFQGWERWGKSKEVWSHMMHRYMIGDNPLGPFKNPKGTRASRTFLWPTYNAFNTQPGIFKFKGKYYSFYHSGKLAAERDKPNPQAHRNVGLDRLYVNPDGTFKFQTITEEGLRQLKYFNPYEKNQAETMAREKGLESAECTDVGGGMKITSVDPGDWIRIIGVDFGTGAESIILRTAGHSKGKMEIRLDSPDGKLAGVIDIPATGSNRIWKTIERDITTIKGVHDLYFKFIKGAFDFNWWSFTGGQVSGKVPPPVVKKILIKSAVTNQYVSLNKNKNELEMTEIQSEKNISKSEHFLLIDNEDGSYSLKSELNGKILSITSDSLLVANRKKIDPSSKFQLRYVNGDYCLKSMVTDKYIYVPEQPEEPLSATMEKPWEDKDTSRARFKIEYREKILN